MSDNIVIVPDSNSQRKIINAEVLFTAFILEHNLPFEVAAHAGNLFRSMFPDSEIAKKYGCAPTKTAAITKYAIAPSVIDPLVKHLKQNPFSLAIDGNSDIGTENLYPLVVRIYDEEKGLVCYRFWHMCLVSDCTAQGICTEVSKAFEKDGIPWCNVIGLSLDNASVNMGKHNGLFRKFEAKKDDLVYTFGCPCHIVHNTARHVAIAFARVTGFDVGDFWLMFFTILTVVQKGKHYFKNSVNFVIRNIVEF